MFQNTLRAPRRDRNSHLFLHHLLARCWLLVAGCSLPSTFNLQPSTFNLQPSAFSLQPSAFSLQPSAFSLQPYYALPAIAIAQAGERPPSVGKEDFPLFPLWERGIEGIKTKKRRNPIAYHNPSYAFTFSCLMQGP